MNKLVLAEVGRTYRSQTDINVVACANCAMPFGITAAFERRRRDDHRTFYCPSGHENWYPQKSDEEKALERARREQERRESAERDAAFWREREQSAQRSLRSTKGHLTRIKNRIANGVCPVPGCKRSGFTNVMSHVAQKHPAWHHDHADELA